MLLQRRAGLLAWFTAVAFPWRSHSGMENSSGFAGGGNEPYSYGDSAGLSPASLLMARGANQSAANVAN